MIIELDKNDRNKIDELNNSFSDVLKDVYIDIKNNPYSNYLLYMINEKIIGYLNYYLIFDRIEIANFNVLEEYQNQKVGLLTVSDYLAASVDPNCKSIVTKSCKNYNYLFSKYDWWTITANKNKSYQAYKIDSSGLVKSVNSSNYARIRPVVALLNAVKYKSGKGTAEDPYVIK